MSTFTEQFEIDAAITGTVEINTGSTYNIFTQNDDLQDITYSQSKITMAEEQAITINPSPFEAFDVTSIDDIKTIDKPTVISAMEGVNLSSYDAQRDPIHGAVINDINTIFNYINLRSDTELMILEKMNMILQYLQATTRTATFATKISTLAEDKSKKFYTNFVNSDNDAAETKTYINVGVSGVPLDATKRDKGGFLISTHQKYEQLTDGTFTKDTDGTYQMGTITVHPIFTLFKRTNFNISESFGDYDCIYARIKKFTHVSNDVYNSAPVFVLKFFSQDATKQYCVHYKLETKFDDYNNDGTINGIAGTTPLPTLVYWGSSDPTNYNFSGPRSYDKKINLTYADVFKTTFGKLDGTDLTEHTLTDTDYTNLNKLILKEITLEIDSTLSEGNTVDTVLYSFGNIVKGGLPQEFICYSS